MWLGTVEADGPLLEIVSGAAPASGLFLARRRVARDSNVTPCIPPSSAPWLTTSRAVILFRSQKCAYFAGLQTAREGYIARVQRRRVVLEAPWIFIAAMVTRIGFGAQVLQVRWYICLPRTRGPSAHPPQLQTSSRSRR
jgi:hypothetical protein